MRSLFEILEGGTHARPEARFHFVERGSTQTLAELRGRALAVAESLHQLGLKPGDAVGVACRTGPEFYSSFFGIAAAGMTVVTLPLPTGLSEKAAYLERITRVARIANVRGVVTDEASAPLARALRDALGDLRFLVCAEGLAAPERDPIEPPPGAAALVQFTSGSTSSPKGVALEADQLWSGVRAIVEGARLTTADILASWLPLYHDMGLFGSLACLSIGIEQYHWSPRSFVRDPARWLAELSKRRATLYVGPNFSYDRILATTSPAQRDALDLSPLRLALNGAEPVSASLLDRFYEFFASCGLRRSALFPVYGLAEATLAVCFPTLGAEPYVEYLDRPALTQDRARLVGSAEGLPVVSVGNAVHGHEVKIRRSDGGRADEREIGEICVRGPAIMRGYVGLEADQVQPFEDGWLLTGDLGYVAGGHVFVTGRRKEMIIVAGCNYYAHDVEWVVRTMTGVDSARCVAVSLPDETIGVIVETTASSKLERDGLKESIQDAVARGLGLNRIAVALVAPRTIRWTSSGKVKRLEMRRAWIDGFFAEQLA